MALTCPPGTSRVRGKSSPLQRKVCDMKIPALRGRDRRPASAYVPSAWEGLRGRAHAGEVGPSMPLPAPLASPAPGQGRPALTVDREPHLLAREAHGVGGRADVGPCIPGGRPGDDQGPILAHVVVGTARRQGIGFLRQRGSPMTSTEPAAPWRFAGSPPPPATLVGTECAHLGPGDGGGGNS